MLIELAVRDIVLIERLDLRLSPGLSVLTGETGAGKSILLDAFSLALGGRGDASLVREGSQQGQVTAVFDLPLDHPARSTARESGLDVDGDLILRRIQFADGRTRALVNDQTVSAQTLRAIGAVLVEIHGQHDDRAMTDPEAHRDLLDAFGGLEQQVSAVAEAWRARQKARQAEAERQKQVEKARGEADFLRHAAAELKKLAPQLGEEDQLSARRTTMQQSEKVARELIETADLLSGQGSQAASIAAALRRLERRAAQAPTLVEPAIRALDALLLSYDEAARAVDEAVTATSFSPQDLEATEERLFALRAASRKYNVPADGLAELRDRFTTDLTAIDAGEGELAALGQASAAADARYVSLAEALSSARRDAAAALDVAVQRELAPLKLEQARFLTQVEGDRTQPGPAGIDRVAFHVQTNPGTRPGPLMKVASGGELSRFLLALKVVLADRGSAPTLVFDEIDSGVGGAVSDAIGQRLERLSSRVQVLTVTHAPQVAARAAHHLHISKGAAGDGARVATRVRALEPDARQEELARMLAGAVVTDEARAAAGRLLTAARGAITGP